jgi:hypothetical protein
VFFPCRIYVNSTADGVTWSGWSEVGGFTDVALSAATFNDRLYLFSEGDNFRGHYVNSTADGITWSGWSEIGGASYTAPSVAAFNNRLYLFVTGKNDSAIYVKSTADGITWSGWNAVGSTTNVALSATAYHSASTNRLYLFAKGENDGIYVNSSADGVTWSGWSQVNGAIVVSPYGSLTTDVALGSAAFHLDALYLAVYLFAKGENDQGIYVNVLYPDLDPGDDLNLVGVKP